MLYVVLTMPTLNKAYLFIYYLHDKKGDLLVTTCGTTFETFTEIESLQGKTTLYGKLEIFFFSSHPDLGKFGQEFEHSG